MAASVFIDGEAGTTGLQIAGRLSGRSDLNLLAIDPAHRKDRNARRELLNTADLIVLCLPDGPAREAVSLIENRAARVLDASTAHRVASGWTYGFPEMTPNQRAEISASARVSNPGCYATGFIALVKPLVSAGLLPPDWPVSVNAISGYSGGGRQMIAEFEEPSSSPPPYRAYALNLGHKHTPEMRIHSGLTHSPLFTPGVGRFYNGMIVEVPLALYALPGAPQLDDVREALLDAYSGGSFVEVASTEEMPDTLDPQSLNGTNRMKIHVLGSEGMARLIAVFDNLGKGAAGAAVQNLNLMLGTPEGEGL